MNIEEAARQNLDLMLSELREVQEDIVRLNDSHAKAIEAAYRDGWWQGLNTDFCADIDGDRAWECSEIYASLHKGDK